MFQPKIYTESENTHYMLSSFIRDRTVYEIIRKRIVKPDMPLMTI